MRYLMIISLLFSSCMSIKRITSTKFTQPEKVEQPQVVEPITVTMDHNMHENIQQTNDVFLNLVLLVVLICMLSVLPKFIAYLKTKWGRYPNDQDSE